MAGAVQFRGQSLKPRRASAVETTQCKPLVKGVAGCRVAVCRYWRIRNPGWYLS